MTENKVKLSELEAEHAKALKEIGTIEPWWSEEDEMFIFEHKAYPMVMYADPDKQTTIEGYHRVLADFINDRLKGDVADFVEKITTGRGGARAGAGRKKKPDQTVRVRIPVDIADWLKDETHINQVRNLMKA